MTTDPTITIAGLRATIEREYYREQARTMAGEIVELQAERRGHAAERQSLTAERDALAAQLAEVRAELSSNATKRDGRISAICRALDIDDDRDVVDAIDEMRSRHANDLASERAHLAACQTRIAGLEQAANERSAEVARLTARVAELEARPVLTVERLTSAVYLSRGIPIDIAAEAAKAILAVLGPVTLPAQDAAERMAAAYCDAQREIGGKEWLGWSRVASGSSEVRDLIVESMRRALASLGAPPTSPTGAPPEVFAGVSVEELAAAAHNAECDHMSEDRPGDVWPFIVRAVLARLEVSLVAPVDPEAVARDFYIRLSKLTGSLQLSAHTDGDRRDRIETMRATLIARGIPVTPEVGK